MIVSRLILKNWRNFRNVDVNLRERQFLVGPNASGKSNLLEKIVKNSDSDYFLHRRASLHAGSTTLRISIP
ncbi:MAG: AAA family ATPase [Candidatus Celaenobacter antarcticus]|nr:AAA family ATPase [Candidatus Celaenobacter antarcticus]